MHFLYKDYLGLLGQFKLLPLLLAAVGMFFAMPVWLADRLYQLLPLRSARYLFMAIFCIVAIWLGKELM